MSRKRLESGEGGGTVSLVAKKFTLDLPRLAESHARSRRMLEGYRNERMKAVEQYVGAHWHGQSDKQIVPLNLISLYVGIVGRALIAKEPRFLISTFLKQYKPVVKAMQDWANKEVEEMYLGDTLKRVVTDALFSVGITKVAIAKPDQSALLGFLQGSGRVMAERVDLDDWCHDMHCRDIREASYLSNRYRVPLEVVRESKMYSSARKEIEATDDNQYNEQGDDRISALGRGDYAGDREELEDFVTLWEVYVPRHRTVLTLAADPTGGISEGIGGTAKPLLTQEWLGPECGPYHWLGLGTVPGNSMPLAPIQGLIDLHEHVNKSYRKVMRQAERLKVITAVRGAADADGNRVMNANDGDMIRVDDPGSIKEVSTGGPHPALMQLAIHLKEIFSFMAGNLEMMGGLSPQSKTATQDKMLNENASRTIADMQDTTIRYVGKVAQSLCWFWHHDPVHVQRSTYEQPGMPELQLERKVFPAGHPDPRKMRRNVPFSEMRVKIDPYSMQHNTPQTRLQALTQVVRQEIIPAMALLQQQGVQFDVNTYLQKLAMYLDMPDLAEIITMREPMDAEKVSGEMHKPGMPQNTNRSYTRENVSTRTERGTNNALMSSLAGQEPGGAAEDYES